VRTRIKICGITRVEDARLAVRLGADAIGFVLWPASPRAVDAELAREIAGQAGPAVDRVGVFVEPAPEDVARAVERVGLGVVQLHDTAPLGVFGTLGLRVFKLAVLDDAEAMEQALALPAHATPIVDAADRVKRGGTGRSADWDRAAELSARRPIVLAGGLTAANVGDAIRRVRPWAVDVSSGVEERPRIKSAARMRAFFDAVAAADGDRV
jgi:phosphoribosylanthranilate isomerase